MKTKQQQDVEKYKEIERLSLYDVLDSYTPEEVIKIMQEIRKKYPDRSISFSLDTCPYEDVLVCNLIETIRPKETNETVS